MIPFKWDNAASTLTIGDREGEFPGMLSSRRFNIVKVSPDNRVGYSRSNKGIEVTYDGKAQTVKL